MRHQILSMLCETATAEGKIHQYDPQPQIIALKQLFQNPEEIPANKLQEVMTTANFPLLFATILSRRLYDQYKLRPSSWKDWVSNDTTPDFRDVDRFRVTRPGTLLQRGEKDEAQATHVDESNIHYGVDEFARQFDIAWRVIVNDDLGFVKRIVGDMITAAISFEDAFVSALYDNAVTQAALVALADARYAGTGRLTAANLAIGVNGMRTRTDPAGRPMNPPGIWLIIPPELELNARVILQSQLLPGVVGMNDENVVKTFIMGYKVDPYITSVPPNIPWYLVADQSTNIYTVTVARLEGWGDAPKLWMRASDRLPMTPTGAIGAADPWMGSFATKDIEFEVEDIIGGWDDATWVGVTDRYGIYYSSGTTP